MSGVIDAELTSLEKKIGFTREVKDFTYKRTYMAKHNPKSCKWLLTRYA